MSIPSSAHGSFRGSLLETTLMGLPSTLMVSLSTIFTSALNVPSIESYFSKCEACVFLQINTVESTNLDHENHGNSFGKFRVLLTFFTPPLSLTTITSRGESFRPCQHRRKFLPMRPNPLIATFNLATVSPLTGAGPPA